MKKISLAFFLILALTGSAWAADTYTLSTYYPAPNGAYAQLRLAPRPAIPGASCDIGLLYVNEDDNNALYMCNDNNSDGNGEWGLIGGAWSQTGLFARDADLVADDIDVFLTSLNEASPSNPNLAVGIGTRAPKAKLHVVSPSDSGPIYEIFSGDGTGCSGAGCDAEVYYRRARGTLATPASVQNGDEITEWYAMAHNGTDWAPAALITFKVDGAPVPGANVWSGGPGRVPGLIDFRTSNDVSRMIIRESGNVGIGTTAPIFALDVKSAVYDAVDLGPNNALRLIGEREVRLEIKSADGDPTHNPLIMNKRSRGTIAAPGNVGIGDTLSEMYTMGYYNSTYRDAGSLRMDVEGTPDDAIPAKWFFNTFEGNGTEHTTVINSKGNIGIGTSAPEYTLDIKSASTETQNQVLRISGNEEATFTMMAATNNDARNPLIRAYRSRGTLAAPTAVQYNASSGIGDTLFELWATGYTSSSLPTHNSGRFLLDVDGTPGTYVPSKWIMETHESDGTFHHMVLDSKGNVGIGTSAPQTTLHISNSSPIVAIQRTNNANPNVLGFYPDGPLAPGNIAWALGTDANSNTFMIAKESDGVPPYELAMAIDSSGNVGIGTPAPTATLEVKGTVRMFGSWQGKSADTVYQATTDGFVVTWASSSYFRVKTDSSNPPTTIVVEAEGNVVNAGRANATVPVRKGDYWKVESLAGPAPTVHWMPMGT